MTLPGSVNSYEQPFFIDCTGVTPGPNPDLNTIIEEISIIESTEFTFFLDANDPVDDPGGAPTPSWTPISLQVSKVDPLDPGLPVDGLTYSGKYSSSIFPSSSITYMDKDLVHHTVNSWDDVPAKDDPLFYKIVNFNPSRQREVTVRYTVKAVIEKGDGTAVTLTKEYTQIVTNDWTRGRDLLVDYTRNQ